MHASQRHNIIKSPHGLQLGSYHFLPRVELIIGEKYYMYLNSS